MTYQCIIKQYNELEKDHLFDICEKRIEVFVCEQHFLCQELDFHDKECSHIMIYNKETKELIAYCRAFQDIQTSDWLIGRVLVVKKERKKNIGIELMKQTINHIYSLDPSASILVHSQAQAQGFYEKCHFQAFGSLFLEEGCPHILMKYQKQ